MGTVLVTVVGPQRRTDLALPDDVALGELIPEIVQLCVDAPAQTTRAQWAVGRLGDQPFAPGRSLDDCGVLEGSLLYLRDMTSPVPPPPPPSGPPRGPRPTAVHDAPAQALAPSGIATGPDRHAAAPPAADTAAAQAYEITGAGLALGIAGLLVVCVAVIVLMSMRGNGGTGFFVDILIIGLAVWGAWNLGILASYGKSHRIAFLTNLPLPPRLQRARDSGTGGRDPWRQQRLERITSLAEEFIYDLGRLLAGHEPPLGYLSPSVANQLRQMAAPFLATGDRMVPRFGDIDLTVHWPRDHRSPIAATATFRDDSLRQTVRGENIAPAPRNVTLSLTVDPGAERIIEVSISASDGRGF